jgi:hypothetical protein
MRITPALSLLLPLTLLAAAGCGVQNLPGSALADNRQDVVISPIALTGGIELNLASSGFQTQATAADVALLEFEITSPVLSGPRVQTFGKTTLPADKRVKFTELPPGAYSVKSVAKDASGTTIGSKTATVNVEAGKTAVVQLSIKLVATEITNPNGNLYIDFDLIDGDVVVKPIAEPSIAPSPTPSASPSANPLAGSLGLYNLTEKKLDTGRFESKGTVYNSATASLTGEIKAEFKEERGIFTKRLEVVETKVFPLVIGAKATYDFTLTSTVKADAVTVTVSVK